MDPGLIIEYNILRMSFSYVVLTTLQEAVYKNHRNFWVYAKHSLSKFKWIWHSNINDQRKTKRKRISFRI